MPYKAQYRKVRAYLSGKLELAPRIHFNLRPWTGAKDSNDCSSRTLTRTVAGGVVLRLSALLGGTSRATTSAVCAGGSSATRVSRRSSRSRKRWVSRSTPGSSSKIAFPSANVRRRTSAILSTAAPPGRLDRRYAFASLIAELEHRTPDNVARSDSLAPSSGRPFKNRIEGWPNLTSSPHTSCSSGACDPRRRATHVHPTSAFHGREEVG